MAIKLVPRTVKAKLLILIGSSFFLLVGWIVGSTALEKKKSFLQGEQLQLQAKFEQVQKVFQDTASEALAMAYVVAESTDAQRLFAERNRTELSRITLPIFKNLKEKLHLAQFQFLTPPATSFLRLHKPEKFDDDLSTMRQTVVQANQQVQPVAGLEIGVAGLGLRGVVPVFFEGRHVGVVEFGKDLDDTLVLPLKEKFGVDVSVIAPDGNSFKYLAKTHAMAIADEQYPFLKKVMDQESIVFDQIHRDGKDILTVYGPLKDYGGKTIGVLVIPSDISETIAAISSHLYKMLGAGAAFLGILLLLLNYVLNSLMKKPLHKLIDQFDKAGRGDLTQRMTGKGLITANGTDNDQASGRDEFAELGASFNLFMSNVQNMVTRLQESVHSMAGSSVELSTLAKDMEQGARISSERVNSVAASAEEMSANMNSVAAASEQAATNVNLVATATEEMSSTISKIAGNTEQASTITRTAVEQARGATEKVNILGHAANEVSKITEVISEISDQTNLLALNATIEAARAGESGKGFAVVANEIKALARQTSDATQQIKKQIDGIQTSTEATIDEIREITRVINQVNEIVNSIASAIEQQSVTTSEIGSNAVQAAQGINEVNENVAQTSTVSGTIASDIGEVSGVVQEMSRNASAVNGRADDLSGLAEQLQALISRFKV